MADPNKIITFFSSRKAHGIENVGSTCYLSTALQCLGHCLTFTYPMIANPPTPNTPITTQLRELYKTTWIKQANANPTPLIHSLKPKLGQIINIQEQNDVMEFIMLFLDNLNTELGVRPPERTHNPKLKGAQRRLVDKMETHWINSHKLAMSFLADITYGQTISQTKCSLCGAIEHVGDIFCNLSLPLSQSTPDISSLLAKLFERENVKKNCDTCKLSNVAATKTLRLWRTPEVLMIHLKRFDHNNRKITHPVNVPEELSLEDYVITESTTTHTYELKAIACHAGSTNYGHYFALVKNPSNQWYLLDDESPPTPIDNISHVNSANYYVLFYERK